MPDNGLEAQPQDLVMTFLGAYVVPRERPVWSGGLVTLSSATVRGVGR